MTFLTTIHVIKSSTKNLFFTSRLRLLIQSCLLSIKALQKNLGLQEATSFFGCNAIREQKT